MIVQFTQDIIEKSLKPIIIEAFAEWCPHCTKMQPIYEELEREFGNKYLFSKFDIDKFQYYTAQFKVESLPSFIFIHNKKEIDRAIGEMPREQLKQLIEKIF